MPYIKEAVGDVETATVQLSDGQTYEYVAGVDTSNPHLGGMRSKAASSAKLQSSSSTSSSGASPPGDEQSACFDWRALLRKGWLWALVMAAIIIAVAVPMTLRYQQNKFNPPPEPNVPLVSDPQALTGTPLPALLSPEPFLAALSLSPSPAPK